MFLPDLNAIYTAIFVFIVTIFIKSDDLGLTGFKTN
jgi:hypothetical protein